MGLCAGWLPAEPVLEAASWGYRARERWLFFGHVNHKLWQQHVALPVARAKRQVHSHMITAPQRHRPGQETREAGFSNTRNTPED